MSDYGNNRNQPAGNRPAPVKHALNDFRFRLVGQDRLEGAPKPPTLGFNISREGIALNAYTNVQGDDDNGRISADLSLQDAMLFFITLERAPRLEPGTHEELAIAANDFNRQTNKREVRPKMSLKVGRDDAGVIYLELASWKRTRPVIRIHMLPSNLLRLVDARGNPMGRDKLSELYAVAWSKSLSQLVPSAYNVHYIPPKELPPRDNNGGGQNRSYGNNQGGGYGGGQRASGNQGGYNGGGGGGNNRSDSSFSNNELDDLPM